MGEFFKGIGFRWSRWFSLSGCTPQDTAARGMGDITAMVIESASRIRIPRNSQRYLRGEIWDAASREAIFSGEKVEIVGVDRMKLIVRHRV